MNLRFLTILIFSFGCCATTKHIFEDMHTEPKTISTSHGLNPYHVKSIYLKDSTYIIHVSRNDSLFKIFSPLVEPLFLPSWLKKDRQPCERLQEGKLYELEIHSLFEVPDKKTSSDTALSTFTTFMTQRRGAILINGSTISFDEESNYNIYYTRNLRGICYLHPDSLLVK
jgi:hypothetical protein